MVWIDAIVSRGIEGAPPATPGEGFPTLDAFAGMAIA